ncbi:MAG TPA: hypothetical protein VN618_01610 [Solirubrobacteraceae bacterium]|nr:hypothetical protein [Solirubrobacteraceae bacterium]
MGAARISTGAALLASLVLAVPSVASAAVQDPTEASATTVQLPLRGVHRVLDPEQQPSGPSAARSEGAQATTRVGEAPAPARSAVSFGENYFGQLGAFFKDKYELGAIPVEGLTGIREVSASVSFNLALLADGTVAAWGGNSHGQLGDGTKRPNWEHGLGHVLVREEDPTTHEAGGVLGHVKQVAAANEHAMALLENGTVLTWGNDEYGQLGNGTQGFERQINVNERLPKVVPGLPPVTAIAAGGGSDYALTSQGTVMAWGNNTEDQLGIGVQGPDHCETAVARYPRYELCSERPLPVMWTNPATGHAQELGEVTAIWAGDFAAYALLRDGRLVSWGANHNGELGTGSEPWRANGFAPAVVRRADGTPLTGLAELAPGATFALARMQNGEVLGWGSDAQGDLAGLPAEECRRELPQRKRAPGRSAPDPRPCVQLPTRIPALEKLHPQALSAGRHFGLAVAAGSVYVWGSDERGQFGDGRIPPPRYTPKGVRRKKEAGSPKPARVRGFGPAIGVVAAGTHSVVLLEGEAPPPLVAARPQALAVGLSWQPQNSTGKETIVGERLLYRVSERGGEAEPAEEGRSEDEEGPPVSLPDEPPYLALLGEPLVEQEEARLVSGQRLTVEPGAWSGARPIVFAYRWERCDAHGEACAPIAGAKHPGYTLTEADVGSTLRAVVTATGPQAPSASVATEPTPPIEAAVEGENLRNPATGVKLTGSALSFTIARTIEKVPIEGKGPGHFRELFNPLLPVPYEVKFAASKRVRIMVLTPLPEEGARPG